MTRGLLFAVCAALALIGGVGDLAASPKRVALVIGNSTYLNATRLKNPENDATDVSAALKSLGFEVVEGRNLDKAGMARTIETFAEKLVGADLALFFYAGHAIQVDGKNYLAPVDARLASPSGLEFEMVRLDVIHRAMERDAKASVIFLDACRDNPMSASLRRRLKSRSMTVGQGLAVVEAGVGSLISFSTQPGNVALDGMGRNSPYTDALVKRLLLAQEDVSELLINVRREVMKTTRNSQIPWEHSSLTRKVYLTAGGSAPHDNAPLSHAQEVELSYWTTVKDSRNPNLIHSYLEKYPKGVFAALAKTMIGEIAAQPGVVPGNVPRVVPGGAPGQSVWPGRVPQTIGAAATPQVVAELQTELKRVGCFRGAINGIWGSDSIAALAAFNAHSRSAVSLQRPGPAAIPIVRGMLSFICPQTAPPRPAPRKARPAPKQNKPVVRQNRKSRSAVQAPVARRKPRPSANSRRTVDGSGMYHGGLCRDGNLDACKVGCARGKTNACRRLKGKLTWQRRVYRW